MPALAPALGPVLLDVASAVIVVAVDVAAVVVGLSLPMLGVDVVSATTRVFGEDESDDEFMTVGSVDSEAVVESERADAVCKTSPEDALAVVWADADVVRDAAVVLALSFVAGGIVVKAVPVHPEGVCVSYTVL